MLGHAALAPATVLAPQRSPNHARYTKVRLVVLPLADQLVDDGFLLSDAVELGHEARVVNHGPGVEEAGKREKGGEEEVVSGLWSVVRFIRPDWPLTTEH